MVFEFAQVSVRVHYFKLKSAAVPVNLLSHGLRWSGYGYAICSSRSTVKAVRSDKKQSA